MPFDLDAGVVAQLGSLPGWASFVLLFGWVIRTWPHWKQKVNEARKIQLDADGARLEQAFTRIRELEETQSKDRREFNEELSNERRRCDAELDDIRKELEALKVENRGLLDLIRQNSRSTAIMIGRPDAVTETKVTEVKKGDKS